MPGFDIQHRDGIAVIDLGERKLIGEGDDYELWDEIKHEVEEKVSKIVLDLSGIKWTNSTGIGIIISAWTMAQKEGAELVLVNSSSRLDNIFKVTNLTYIMKVFGTVGEALDYLRTGRES